MAIPNFKGHDLSVAVYQCKNLGDGLLTTPMIDVLCAQSNVQSVTVICKAISRPIFESLHPKVRIISEPRSIRSMVRALMVLRVDIMLLPHRSRKGFFIGLCAGAKCVSVGFIKPILGFSPKYLPQRMTPWRHTAEVNLDLLRICGFSLDSDQKCLSLKSLLSAKEVLPCDLPKQYVVVHPGSRWMFKTPSFNFWKAVINEIGNNGISVLLTGETRTQEGRLIKSLENACNVQSLAGATTIGQLAMIISRASGYLGVDTFATHMAAASGVPGIAIYGPTSSFIWGPYGVSNRIKVLNSTQYSCLPCQNDGCGGSKVSDCLEDMNPSMVADRFLRELKKTSDG